MRDTERRGEAPTISVVVVTYNSADTVAACVASVDPHAELLVVDQGSTDTSVAEATRVRPDARIVHAGANRGFGAGCNLGAANAGGDVVVFLNPDAEIDALSLRLLAEAAMSPEAGLVGPTIVDGDGTEATRCRTWSSPVRDAVNLVAPLPLLPARLLADIPPSDAVYRRGGAVPYIQGSCMAVQRDVLQAAGGFDEEFFIYGEEEWLAARLAVRGRASLLVPEARARHVGATSTAKTGGFAVEQLYRARVLMYYKRLGTSRALAGAALLAAALVALLVTTPARRLVRFRPKESAAWCVSALRGLWSGVRRTRVTPPADRRAP